MAPPPIQLPLLLLVLVVLGCFASTTTVTADITIYSPTISSTSPRNGLQALLSPSSYDVCAAAVRTGTTATSTPALPLTLRFPSTLFASTTTLTSSTFRLPSNIEALEEHLLTIGITASLTVGDAITPGSSSSSPTACSAPFSTAVPTSFELRFCAPDAADTSQNGSPIIAYPLPPTTATSWCPTSANPAPTTSPLTTPIITTAFGQPFGIHTLSPEDQIAFVSTSLTPTHPLIATLGASVRTMLDKYFANTATDGTCAISCFFDALAPAAKQTCGDGRVGGASEECEVFPMLTASRKYLTTIQLTSIMPQLGCNPSTCKRTTTTHTPLYIGSDASATGPALADVCSKQSCGLAVAKVMNYACGKGATANAGQWDQEGCFSWIGVPNPLQTNVDCYAPPTSDACVRGLHVPGWVCRAPDVEFVDYTATASAVPPAIVYGTNMNTSWTQCGEAWGDLRFLSNGSNPPIYHPIQRDQVRCDQNNVLLARTVRCGVTGGAVHFKDEDCRGKGAKPPSTTRAVAAKANKCDYLAYHDVERLSKNDPLPSFPALINYVYYSDDLTKTTGFVGPAYPLPHQIQSCTAEYSRHYKCVAASYVPIPGSIIGEYRMTVTASTKCATNEHTENTNEVDLVSQPDRCTFGESCKHALTSTDEISCTDPVFDCDCSKPEEIPRIRDCFVFPPSSALFAPQKVDGVLCSNTKIYPYPDPMVCTDINRKNNCYRWFLTIRPTLPTIDRLKPVTYYSSQPKLYFNINYCDIGISMTWLHAVFSLACATFNADGSPKELAQDGYLCPQSLLQCSTGPYRKCTAVIATGGPDQPTLDQLRSLGYDDVEAMDPTFEKCLESYRPSIKYCGRLNIDKVATCFQTVGGVETEVDGSVCDEEYRGIFRHWPPTPFSNNCHFNCYDNNKLVDGKPTLLGPCPSDRLTLDRIDHQQFACGSSTLIDNVCSVSTYNVEAKCEMKVGDSADYLPVSSSYDGCDLNGVLKKSWKGKQTITDKCFKLSATKSLSHYSFHSQSYSLETDFASSECKFQTECRIGYSDSGNILSLATIPVTAAPSSPFAGVFSSAICSGPSFDCARKSICGTVSLDTRCRITKNGVDVYDEENPLSTLAAAIGVTSSQSICSKMRLPAGCSNTEKPNCYETRCGMNTETATLTSHTVVPPFSQFTSSLCNAPAQYKHCTTKLTDGHCDDSTKATVIKKCANLRSGTEASPCSGPNGTCNDSEDDCTWDGDMTPLDVECPNYKKCTFGERGCFWASTPDLALSHNQPVFDYPDKPSAALCAVALDKSLTEEQVCGTNPNTNLCGTAQIVSSCFVHPPNRAEPPFTLDNDLCQFYYGAQGVSTDKNKYIPISPTHPDVVHGQCENYHRCSAWACSETFTSATAADQHQRASAKPQNPATFFDPVTGLLNEDLCTRPLSPQTGEQGICSAGLVQRNVKCLERITAQYSTSPSVRVSPTMIDRCGVLTNTPNLNSPLSSLPLNTLRGCKATLECSHAGGPYSPSHCPSPLVLPTIDSLVPPQTLSWRCPVVASKEVENWAFHFDMRCRSNNNTFVDLHHCTRRTNPYQDIPFYLVTPLQQQCRTCTEVTPPAQLPLTFENSTFIVTPDAPHFTTNPLTGTFDRQTIVDRESLGYAICSSSPPLIFPPTILEYPYLLPSGSTIYRGASYSFSTTAIDAYYDTVVIYLVSKPAPLTQNSPETVDTSKTNRVLRSMSPSSSKFPFQQPPNTPDDSTTTFSPSLSYPLAVLLKDVTSNTLFSNDVTIPTDIDLGEYLVVAFHDSLTFVLSPDLITIADSPSPVQLQPINNSCGTVPCYGGTCKNGLCSCSPGFSGPSCMMSSSIAATCEGRTTVPNPTNPSSTIICHPTNGFIGPSFALTAFNPKSALPPAQFCTTCHCLGQFDPLDGCTTCNLDCGPNGTPMDNCAICQCRPGYSGSACQCSAHIFPITYFSPPSIVSTYFQHLQNPDLNLWTDQHEYQLNLWKAHLIVDVARDIRLPVDSLEIADFGIAPSDDDQDGADQTGQTSRPPFIVHLAIRICTSNTASADDSTARMDPTSSDEASISTLDAQHASITQRLSTFSASLTRNSPFAQFDNRSGIIEQHIHPSFNYTTLTALSPPAGDRAWFHSSLPSSPTPTPQHSRQPLQTPAPTPTTPTTTIINPATLSASTVPLLVTGVSGTFSPGGAYHVSPRLYDVSQCAEGIEDQCPPALAEIAPFNSSISPSFPIWTIAMIAILQFVF